MTAWEPAGPNRSIPMAGTHALRSGRSARTQERPSKSSTACTMPSKAIAAISIVPSRFVTDQGIIQQWFGTCTDIEEQKHYQQIPELQN